MYKDREFFLIPDCVTNSSLPVVVLITPTWQPQTCQVVSSSVHQVNSTQHKLTAHSRLMMQSLTDLSIRSRCHTCQLVSSAASQLASLTTRQLVSSTAKLRLIYLVFTKFKEPSFHNTGIAHSTKLEFRTKSVHSRQCHVIS